VLPLKRLKNSTKLVATAIVLPRCLDDVEVLDVGAPDPHERMALEWDGILDEPANVHGTVFAHPLPHFPSCRRRSRLQASS
jgi:hypothetical protein